MQPENTNNFDAIPWWKLLVMVIPASYRPELHYMRGRGPKWHAKHDRAPSADHAMTALVRYDRR